jgi:very-short-patch-repair endonuclease
MADEHGTPRLVRSTCVAQLAAKQWGCVTTEQLVRCGLSPRTIGRWVDEERLHRLHRGIYAVGHRSPAPEQRWQAALLGYGDDSVLSRHTALALHGLGPPPKGLRTTSIERTLLDLTAVGEPVKRLVAEAVAKRLTSIAKLRTCVERHAGARGSARLGGCIAGRQTRSKLEKEFVAWLEDRDIPVPLLNERFGPFTLDGMWPAARLVLEIDAFATHGTAHSFEADRRRDAYTAACGLRTIRVTPTRWRGDGDRLERDLLAALAA